MSNDVVSCANCIQLKILLEERNKEIENLNNKIKNLEEILKSFDSKISKTCDEKCSQLNAGERLNEDGNLCDAENFKNASQSMSKEEYSSEDYIYNEAMKMYYCISTGYYYDRTSGLYYVPENKAYYTYDYSENAYVLYSGTSKTSEEDPNEKNNNISNDLDDCKKSDESCESVVNQVNNFHISDDVEPSLGTLLYNELEKLNDEKVEKDNDLEKSSDLNNDWQAPSGTNLTVQDLVREVAEQHSGMSDYIYDENSKMYYSSSTGYYYDAVRNLLYDPNNAIYYQYDQDTGSYQFYHKVESNVINFSDKRDKVKARRRYWRKKQKSNSENRNAKVKAKHAEVFASKEENNSDAESYSSPEEGEVFDSESDEELPSQPETFPSDESSMSACSPCIRAIVKSSEKLKIGTLILITCSGAVIGKNKSNPVHIPDTGISKLHAEIKFDEKLWKYNIRDLGSQNGTFINDSRLSQPKEESQPHNLNHGDIVCIGSCKFLFHIHIGHETCDDCEPGQIMAELLSQEEKPVSIFKTKEEKEKERRQEVRRLKKKYGLEGMNYEEKKSLPFNCSSKYEDKAELRRKTFGSDNPYEKTETASLNQTMAESNKGYQMLKKLGWTEGNSLGTSTGGIIEPIPFRPWISRAGLGSSEEQQQTAVLNSTQDKRNKKWIKAQERFLLLS